MDDPREFTAGERAVAETLGRRYRSVSRRSFFSRVTRIAFAVAGVALLDKSPLFAVPTEHDRLEDAFDKVATWMDCGLNGYKCGSGACTGGTLGTGPTAKWVACCKKAANDYRCCEYADRCGTRPAGWPSGCDGVTPAGALWCGGASGEYICTEISCSSTCSSTTAAGCSCGPSPSC